MNFVELNLISNNKLRNYDKENLKLETKANDKTYMSFEKSGKLSVT